MTYRVLLNAAIVATFCMLQPLIAAADQLNVKLGLWEITSVTQMGGTPVLPKELHDTMTPQQRTAVTADMKAEAAQGPKQDVSRTCLTQSDVEQPFSSSDGKDCKQTILATTHATQEVRLVCSGERKGSGVLTIKAPNAETMTGELTLQMGEGPDPFMIKSQLRGRWLDSDCGDEAEDVGADDDDAEQDDPFDDEE